MSTSIRKSRADLSVIEYPAPKRNSFFRQLAVLPFESALALVSVWSGLSSLFGLTTAGQAFNAALPPWMVIAFNLLYVLSGLAIALGIGWGYRNLEACGLILLLTSLLVRGIAIVVTSWDTNASGVVAAQFSSAVFIGATLLRLMAIFHRATVIHVNGTVTAVE